MQTGCCPHTAIRDDISANLDAVEELEARLPGPRPGPGRERRRQPHRDLLATGWSHRQIFVLDVAGGDKVPRKGGPGVTRSDLLVINKTDLAPLVGADLAVMERDARAVREGRPVLFTSLVQTTEVPGRRRLGARRTSRARVISSGRAVVEPGGVLRSVPAEPPLTMRQVFSRRRPGVCALCLVGSAAGPLAGDDVRFDLTVEARCRGHADLGRCPDRAGTAGGRRCGAAHPGGPRRRGPS